MTTSSTIHLDPTRRPVFAVPELKKSSADMTSKLLQENHETHHIFFNQLHYHNHITHHLLTLYALGATPDAIQAGYDKNASYQKPMNPLTMNMHDPEIFKKCLGNGLHYNDFLTFFQSEISAKGWQNVVNEYLFNGDDRSEDMFVRLFAGLLHPIIHLGLGIEFEQPAIIAEALAQIAVHENYMASFLPPAEEAAKTNGDPSLSLVQILDEMRQDEKLRNTCLWGESDKLRNAVIGRAHNEIIKYTSKYTLRPEQLEQKVAEMTNITLYYTGAALRPSHIPKIDFLLMHSVNSSIFFSAFISAPWISTATKIRLLECKVRTDLAVYIVGKAPEPHLEMIIDYQPKKPSQDINSIFERVTLLLDDGHASKLIRTIAHGREVCKKWEDQEGFMLKGDMWLKLAHLVMDSLDAGEPRWVRGAGFDEAWVDVPSRGAVKL